VAVFSKYGGWLDFSCEIIVILLIIALLCRQIISKLKNKLIKDSRNERRIPKR